MIILALSSRAWMMRLLLLLVLVLPLALAQLHHPLPASAGSCAQDSHNLLQNGTMAPGAPNAYGVVAAGWTAFVVGPNVPHFENAANEGWDPNGSQYIWKDLDTWDAGIYQTVTNLTPGQTYHFWLVWGQALHDMGGDNARATQINRQLGVDLNGGTDPTSPNVQWTVPYYGTSGFNRPEWNLYFVASSSTATFFLRAQNGHRDGRNKVFFDTACLFPANGTPTTTPWAPTATPPGNVTRYDDTDPAIQHKGTWTFDTDPQAINATYSYARGIKGKPVAAIFSFTGTDVTLWYIGWKNRGKAKIVIDGVARGKLDQYRPTLEYNLSQTYGGLTDGPHTLKIKNAGAKNPEATDSIIVIDALDVYSPSAGNNGNRPRALFAPTPAPLGYGTAMPTSTGTATPVPTPTDESPPAAYAKRPHLLAPEEGAHLTKRKVRLDWSDVTCAEQYDVQGVKDNPEGERVAEVTTSLFEFTRKYKRGQVYYFRARACNANGCSRWTAWRSFYVD